MKKTMLLLLCIAFTISAAQISIESISEYDSRTMVFTVTESYEVKVGDILIIPAGAQVHFAPLTGITVKGEILIDGKPDRPVTLTSRRAAQRAGAAHDWQGITLFPTATATLKYTVISFASWGVKSCCDNVDLVNVTFVLNGTNFQVGERRIFAKDREPIYYERTVTKKINVNHNPEAVDYDAIIGKTYLPKRTFVIGPLAAAALVGGGIYINRWVKSVDKYNNYKPGDPHYDRSNFDQREERFKDLKSDITLNAVLGIGLTTLGVASGTYITIYTIKF